MVDNNLWKPFGITDPVKELAAHSNPAMQAMSVLAESMKIIDADLEVYFAAMTLMSYAAGLSDGRLTTLEDPKKAFLAELDLLTPHKGIEA